MLSCKVNFANTLKKAQDCSVKFPTRIHGRSAMNPGWKHVSLIFPSHLGKTFCKLVGSFHLKCFVKSKHVVP